LAEYDKVIKYYDTIFRNFFDYEAEVISLDKIFKEWGVKRVWVPGCGTGNHLIPLAKLGYQCVGTDISSKLLEQAKKKAKGLKVNFIEDDLRNTRLANQQFDGIVCLYVTYSEGKEENFNKAIKSMHNNLKKEGLLFLNLANAECEISVLKTYYPPPIWILHEKEKLKIVQLNNAWREEEQPPPVLFWDNVYLIEDNSKLLMLTVRDRYLCYSRDEIKKNLSGCGFTVKSFYSNPVGLVEWHKDSFYTFVLAQKIQ
jgi:SAM-dependent methyltransferase